MEYYNLVVLENGESIPETRVKTNGKTDIIHYDEFLRICEDFSVDRDLCIDVNAMPSVDMFEAICESVPSVRWFSPNGMAPEYTPTKLYDKIEIWDTEVNLEEKINEDEYHKSDIQLEDVHTGASSASAPTQIPDVLNDNSQSQNDNMISSFHGGPIQGTSEEMAAFSSLIDMSIHGNDDKLDNREARIVLFGSAKGGTGKTFTSLISTYRYAKKNPTKRICHVDLDVIGGQVGITIHKPSGSTFKDFYAEYLKGNRDFSTMKNFRVQSNKFPQNVDFYLGAKSYIDDDNFWQTVLANVIKNYDVVVIDSGIDYVGYPPITYAYKIADKINIISSTSPKSVDSTIQQIIALSGNDPTGVFTPEDELASKIFLVITQAAIGDPVNDTVLDIFQTRANVNVIAMFAEMTATINKAEFYGYWNIFDNEKDINDSLDRIME